MNPSTLALCGGICIHSEAYKGGMLAVFQRHGSEKLKTLVLTYDVFTSEIQGYSFRQTDTSNLDDAIALARGEIDHYIRDTLLPVAIDADITDETGGTNEAAVRLLMSEG